MFDIERINYRIPASITSFEETENPYLTKGKLKVFYKGLTGDKRLFNDKFSEQLLATIPQMPIVGYYDEKKDDFIGHNSQQFVYGYVPENPSLEFVEEDDKTFAVTDVILWTGRDDNIGEVSKKIIGKKQSLEMDPSTVEYVINKDANGNFENLEFTGGSIIGLSVLGDDQTPAFEGSEFFTNKIEEEPEYKESFVKFINEARELLSSKQGGVSMNIEEFLESKKDSKGINFMKETYQERSMKVHLALEKSIGYDFYIEQLGDEEVIYYDYGKDRYFRSNYALAEETVPSFTEPVQVFRRYLSEEEIKTNFEKTAEVFEEGAKIVEEKVEESTVEANVEESVATATETVIEESKVEDLNKIEGGLEDATEANKEEISEQDSESPKPEFTSEERIELETFRRKEKENILTNYTEYLTQDQVKKFTEEMSNYNSIEFEKELKLTTFEIIKERANKPISEEEGRFSFREVEKNNDSNTATSDLDRLLNK